MKPRPQGDWGELVAFNWLIEQGAVVSVPWGHSPDYDFVADLGGRLLRIQVKSSRCFRNGRYELQLSTAGGNQSWTRTVKLFSEDRCDYVFAVVACGRRWFIPAREVQGRHGIRLGGPKYSEFEVSPGPAMPFAAMA